MWPVPPKKSSALGRDHFERLYRSSPDPWRFETSAYEARKREATLAALPLPRYERGFEIGCSIGVLTTHLAERCGTLLSVDIAEAALVLARHRCRDLSHVRFERMRVPDDLPNERFDLIVLSEVGYFWSPRALHRARRRLVARLRAGGHLLLVHWTGAIPESPSPVTGDEVHGTFFDVAGLVHVDGNRERAYRLDLFERRPASWGRIVQASAARLLRRRDRGVVVHLDLPPDGVIASASSDAHRIVLAGWAGAREGVASVEVSLGGDTIGPAAFSEPRLDVARIFPEFGRNTGFVAELSPVERVQGRHVIQVTARSRHGRVGRARQQVEIRRRRPAIAIASRPLPGRDALTQFLGEGGRLDFTPARPVSLSVVVVLHNRAELTLACLRSLRAATGVSFELILVDNASSDGTAALLEQIDGATILRNSSNSYYVRAANQGARVARGEHVLLLNSDTEIYPDSLAAAMSRLTRDRSIGVVGGRLVLYSGRLQEAGGITWQSGRCLGYGRGDAPDAPAYMFVRDVDYCGGAFLATPRALFESLGGLDERFAPGYYDDADYCLRIWDQGRRVVFEPRVKVWHVEHGSGTRDEVERCIAENHGTFYERHRAALSTRSTEDPTRSERARVHGRPPAVLVVGDELPLLVGNPAHERVRHRLRTLQAAGFVVTFHPLSSERASWDAVYAVIPDTVEVMNGYGAAFLGPLLDDRAGDDSIVVLATSNPLAASMAETHGHRDACVFDAWAIGVESTMGMPALSGPDDLRLLTRAAGHSIALDGSAPSRTYADWLRRYDYLTETERQDISGCVSAWRSRPRFRVLLVPIDVPPAWVRAAVDSLRHQVYADWDLHVAGPMPEAWWPVLRECAARDPRICLDTWPCGCPAPDYMAVLEPDTELHPLALVFVALAVREAPGAALVYTDEDRLTSTDGLPPTRVDPYFKPDWNPDLLLGQNYIGGFAVLRGGSPGAAALPSTLDQLALRRIVLGLADTLGTADVLHVPRVLQHRRGIGFDAVADARVVQDALRRRGEDADVEPGPGTGVHRIRYRLSHRPSVSVLVATRDRADLLRRVTTTLFELTRYDPFEVCIIDNDSVEPDALAFLGTLSRDPRVRVSRSPGTFNYSTMHNRAVFEARAEIVVFLNNDTEIVSPAWLDELVAQTMRADVGAVGARLLFSDGTLQHAGVVLGAGGIASHAFLGQPAATSADRGRAHAIQEYSAVTAACMAMRRDVFLGVGGFADHLAVRFNDVDLCLRLREAGYRIVWTPHAVLLHHHAASIGQEEETAEARSRFAREVAHMSTRWGDRLRRDPFYNPNLDQEALDFSLAFPPALPRLELPCKADGGTSIQES